MLRLQPPLGWQEHVEQPLPGLRPLLTATGVPTSKPAGQATAESTIVPWTNGEASVGTHTATALQSLSAQSALPSQSSSTPLKQFSAPVGVQLRSGLNWSGGVVRS